MDKICSQYSNSHIYLSLKGVTVSQLWALNMDYDATWNLRDCYSVQGSNLKRGRSIPMAMFAACETAVSCNVRADLPTVLKKLAGSLMRAKLAVRLETNAMHLWHSATQFSVVFQKGLYLCCSASRFEKIHKPWWQRGVVASWPARIFLNREAGECHDAIHAAKRWHFAMCLAHKPCYITLRV